MLTREGLLEVIIYIVYSEFSANIALFIMALQLLKIHNILTTHVVNGKTYLSDMCLKWVTIELAN